MSNLHENARQAETFGSGQHGGLDCKDERVCALPPDYDYTSSDGVWFPCPATDRQSEAMIPVTLDNVFYKVKPQGREFVAITKRLQQSGSTSITPKSFCEHVRRGGSWVGALYEASEQGWGRFIGQRLFGLDFDNSFQGRPLAPDEEGFLDPVDALDRCEGIGLEPLCLYFTMSARCPDWPKYRLAFDMREVLEEKDAHRYLHALLGIFPEADQACKNLNRIFLGSQGEVWPCWEGYGDER